MASLIRTHTYIKYARLNLQEAEAALQQEDMEQVARRCQDAAVAMLKALAASMYGRKADIESLDRARLERLLKDLAESPDQVQGLAQALLDLKAGAPVRARAEAEALYSKTGRIFSTVHDLCVS